ncbi:MAG: hypothetical protein P4L87_11775 [Formivibrio sp.]|nr:hypothetical protein [Formivibrio sp.]
MQVPLYCCLKQLTLKWENRALLISSDCVGYIYKAMRRWPEEEVLCGIGFDLLLALTRDADAQMLEMLSRGLDHLYRAVHGCHVVVVGLACGLLERIAAHPETALKIVTTDGLNHVYAMMEAHIGEENVQKAACDVLKNLSSHGEIGLTLLPRGLNLLGKVVRKHTNCAAVLESAVTVLLNLTATPQGLLMLREGGRAFSILQRAKTAHPGVASLVSCADLAMRALL